MVKLNIIKLENNFMSKFVFVEHKSIQDNENKKDVVYFRYEKILFIYSYNINKFYFIFNWCFRVCVPLNKNIQPYLDVFCPFSPCLGYSKNIN